MSVRCSTNSLGTFTVSVSAGDSRKVACAYNSFLTSAKASEKVGRDLRYHAADQLMNPATYGCRNAERSSWCLRRHARFSEAASHWPRTRARGILLPPRSTQEGERHEHEQAGARPTDPRMGSIGAALRVARAGTLRDHVPREAVRRQEGGLRRRGGDPQAGPEPRSRRLQGPRGDEADGFRPQPRHLREDPRHDPRGLRLRE